MAKLTANGITFGDLTELNSRRGIFPQSTSWIFYQSSAPTGWTQVTTHNNKALRVVSGSGGGSAGTSSFTTIMSTLSVAGGTLSSSNSTGGTALATPQLPSHTHPSNGVAMNAVPANFNPDGGFTGWNGGDVVRSGGWTRNSPGTGNEGSGGSHSHPFSASGSVPTQTLNIAVQYIDVIVCTFDG
jgi:hypothetical protein